MTEVLSSIAEQTWAFLNTPRLKGCRPMIDLLSSEFGTITESIRAHAAQEPQRRADGGRSGELCHVRRIGDQVTNTLQRDGIGQGDAIAICATTSIEYSTVFLGALRAGVVVVPRAPG